MSEQHRASTSLLADAPVVQVTLFEDRARVLRRGRVELPTGVVKVCVDDVAPVLSDASLTAAIENSAEGARVVDARVRRRIVVRNRNEKIPRTEIEKLERERDALEREIRRIAARAARLERRSESLESLLKLTLTEIGEDAAWGRQEASRWAERLESLRGKNHDVADRLVGERHELGEQRSELERLDRRLAALRNPSQEEWAGIETEISVDRAGTYELRVEYVVPGACWRPWHTARLLDDRLPRVAFRTDGCVWQNTGEEWRDARLLFSTQRPSLATEPPKLTRDVLQVQKRSESVVVETRESEITTTGLGPEATPAERLPGIDDGGETVCLESETPSTVPSDGRAYRVPLLRFETETDVSLVASPELFQAVFTKSVQSNQAAAPLLAGPVDLIRGGGFAGRTSLLYVAAGERFALGWGPEPELRLQREIEVHHDKQKTMSHWESRQHRATIRLSNIGSRERTVKVTERLPVSEIDMVRVLPGEKETTGGVRPDENGFVEWTVGIPACRLETLTLKYTVKKHQDVQGI